MLKIGDKIRRTDRYLTAFIKGKLYTVTAVRQDGLQFQVAEQDGANKDLFWSWCYQFQLCEEAAEQKCPRVLSEKAKEAVYKNYGLHKPMPHTALQPWPAQQSKVVILLNELDPK